MNKKTAVQVLVLVLIVVVVGIGCFSMGRAYQEKGSVIGTFSNGDMSNYEYITIDRENHYLQYNQEQIILDGVITVDDEIVYVQNDSQTLCAVYLDSKLYIFEKENEEIRVFEKISDKPTYINLEHIE